MKGKKENGNWFSDIDSDSVEKSAEIPPQIDLPQPTEPSIVVQIASEPKEVNVPSRKGDTMMVCEAIRKTPEPIMTGTMILPKSLRFNMAKAIRRNGGDYTKSELSGTKWRIHSVMDDGNKYYQAEMLNEIPTED